MIGGLEALKHLLLSNSFPTKQTLESTVGVLHGYKFGNQSPHICIPFASFVSSLATTKQIEIGVVETEKLLEELMSIIKHHQINNSVLLPTLRALGHLLLCRGPKLQKKRYKTMILSTLMPLANPDPSFHCDVNRLAVNCLANYCSKCGNKMKDQYPEIMKIMETNFWESNKTLKTNTTWLSFKHICTTLRGLGIIITESKSIHSIQLAPLLHTLKKLINFGNNGEESLVNHQKSLELVENNNRSYKDAGFVYSSDSEQEYTETWKVRFHALNTVQAIVRADAKGFYPFWKDFLPYPSHHMYNSSSSSVFYIILNDDEKKVRAAAVTLLSAIIETSRPFMIAVDSRNENNSKRAFVSFSQTLGKTVEEMHNILLEALYQEFDLPCLQAILKCLSVLMTNSPYERLPHGFLTKIWNLLKHVMLGKEKGIWLVVHALPCLATLMRNKNPEAEQLVLKDTHKKKYHNITDSRNFLSGNEEEEEEEEDSNEKVSLIQSILTTISQFSLEKESSNKDKTRASNSKWGQKEPTADSEAKKYIRLMIEMLRVISSFCFNFKEISTAMWPQILASVSVPMCSSKIPLLRFHGVKVIEDFLTSSLANDSEDPQPTLGQDVWFDLLDNYFPSFFTDYSPNVRACVSNCLSCISPEMFASLPVKYSVLIKMQTLGSITDAHPQVRAAASRTLGVYILFPCLYEDPLFLSDAALGLVKALQDSNVNVRVKACWGLANLCDLMTQDQDTKSGSSGSIALMIPEQIILKVCDTMVEGCKDIDRIKANAVRGLGNLGRVVTIPKTDPNNNNKNKGPLFGIETKIAQSLVHSLSTSSAKVKWNTCYAITNFLCNPSISWCNNSTLIEPLLAGLITELQKSNNFKIRINASVALGMLEKREDYGSCYFKVIKCLLNELESLQDPDIDYSLRKYVSSLTDNVIFSLSNVIGLHTSDDVAALQAIVLPHANLILHLFSKSTDFSSVSSQWVSAKQNSMKNKLAFVELLQTWTSSDIGE
eukprot:CAMPEP_0174274186 /NCGR_PEP_ID=MMETSP0439-20130205/57149_1 /TAXON_ID=0 /ORGANISM="Stereomyxa ramosa, Strain Chinc5" /LENGTH=998 /DNA_ID=CAMNT_0015365805 /DNA_START=130 /DNA_END=3126 /DNA_ORIENTATION=-